MMASNLQVVFLEEISLPEVQKTLGYDALTPEARIAMPQFKQAHLKHGVIWKC